MTIAERIDLVHAEIGVHECAHPLVRYELRERLRGAGFRLKPTPDVIETTQEVLESIEHPWTRFETLSGVVHFYQGPEGGQPL